MSGRLAGERRVRYRMCCRGAVEFVVGQVGGSKVYNIEMKCSAVCATHTHTLPVSPRSIYIHSIHTNPSPTALPLGSYTHTPVLPGPSPPHTHTAVMKLALLFAAPTLNTRKSRPKFCNVHCSRKIRQILTLYSCHVTYSAKLDAYVVCNTAVMLVYFL